MTGIGDGIKFGIIVVGADPLHPVIDTGRRSLAGHLFDISDVDIALLIDGVPELLFGPACFCQDFRSLRIEHKHVRSSGYAIALDVVCYGRDVVLDRRRGKAARYNLAVGTEHRYSAILRLQSRIIHVELIPRISLLPRSLSNQRMPTRRSAENGFRKLSRLALSDVPKNQADRPTDCGVGACDRIRRGLPRSG